MPPTIGFESVTEMPKVVAGLMERGYAAQPVLQIIGGNGPRLLGHAWTCLVTNSGGPCPRAQAQSWLGFAWGASRWVYF